MAEYRKQHYVQQSYLLSFAKGNQICVFDKFLNKAYPASVRDVAQQANFYRLPGDLEDKVGTRTTIDPNFVEKWFQAIENILNAQVEPLITLDNEGTISAETRYAFSRFLVYQYLRTKALRSVIKDAGEQLITKLMEKVIELNFGEDQLKYMPKVDYSDKAAALMQIQQLMDEEKVQEMADILTNHIWQVCVNDTAHPFYTSDTPVVLHNHLKRPKFRPGKGLGSAGIEIAWPISSTRLLSLVDRNMFGPRAPELDGKVHEASTENVMFYNSLQVIESERQIFCERPEWNLVEDMIRDSPGLTEPQSRVSVD